MQFSNRNRSACALIACAVVLSMPNLLFAQFGEAWQEFQDPATGSICGIINAPSANLTVIDATGEVVRVDGVDNVLLDWAVSPSDEVFFGSTFVGDILYADDADGLPALFIIDIDGFVVDVTEISQEPVLTDILPDEIANTDCDACNFVDDDGGLCSTGGGGGFGGNLCGTVTISTMASMMISFIGLGYSSRRMRRRMRATR